MVASSFKALLYLTNFSNVLHSYRVLFPPYKVVRLVTAGLTALQSAEQRWLYLFDALEGRKYSIASRHLKDAKCHIIEATRG